MEGLKVKTCVFIESNRVIFQDESRNFLLWSIVWKMLVSITQYKMTLTKQQSLKGNLRFGEKKVYKLIFSPLEVSMTLVKRKDETS